MRTSAFLLLLATTAVSPEIRYFQYQRPLRIVNQQDAQTCASLDPTVYAHASKELADLRLYRDGKTEIPYVLWLTQPKVSTLPIAVPINLGVRNGKTVFDAEMPDDGYAELFLSIQGQDFLATVAVFGSQDPLDKSTKLGDFPIFDFSRQSLGRSTILRLGKTNFRYLHFQISGNLKPEQISGIRIEKVPDLERQ